MLRAALALTAALAVPASATDFYVDAVNGSDVTGDGSAANPWQTIGHAVAIAPYLAPDPALKIAAGTYDASIGETFGYSALDVTYEGAGVGQTILDGRGASSLLTIQLTGSTNDVVLSGMTLRNAGTGVTLTPDFVLGFAGATLSDLEICNVTTGVRVVAGLLESSNFRLERSVLRDCDTGALADGISGSASISLFDTVIEGCGTGAQASSSGFGGSGSVRLTQCEVRNCGTGVATEAVNGNFGSATLDSTLVADCGIGVTAIEWSTLFVQRSTITNNGQGILATQDNPEALDIFLNSSNVWGNQGLDLDPAFLDLASYTNTTAAVSPAKGNLDVDPLFADPENGDYHLTAGSPLIDAGDPGMPAAGTDNDKDPRVLDGDLDANARLDIGHDEHNPTWLDLSGPLQTGVTTNLVTGGPAGWSYCTGWSTAKADIPYGPWGNLLVAPGRLVLAGCGLVPGNDPLAVPANPALVGVPVHLQSFAYATPPGPGSFSNRVDAVVQ